MYTYSTCCTFSPIFFFFFDFFLKLNSIFQFIYNPIISFLLSSFMFSSLSISCSYDRRTKKCPDALFNLFTIQLSISCYLHLCFLRYQFLLPITDGQRSARMRCSSSASFCCFSNNEK